MKWLCTLILACLWSIGLKAQCDYYNSFSSTAGWTQVGSNVEIHNGILEFKKGATDGSQRRVYTSLGDTLNSHDKWVFDMDFRPLKTGTYPGSSFPMAGHAILSLTAGIKEPFSDCPNVACTGYPVNNQDGIMVLYSSNNPADGNLFFHVIAKDGKQEYKSLGRINATTMNYTYYLRLERTSPTKVKLSVFSDSLRTKLYNLNPPLELTIPASIEGLNTIQHGNVARGWNKRQLWTVIDNVCKKKRECIGRKIAKAGPDQFLCNGADSVRLTGSGGQKVQWSSPDFTDFSGDSNITVWVDKSTLFRFEVMDTSGCRDVAYTMVALSNPVANAGADTVICQGDTAQLRGSGGHHLKWLPGSVSHQLNFDGSISLQPRVSETINLVAFNKQRTCSDTDTVVVHVSKPKASLGPNQTICLGDSAKLNGSGGVSYKWMFDSNAIWQTKAKKWVSPLTTEPFGLEVADSLGCKDTTFVHVIVQPNPEAVAGADREVCPHESISLLGRGGKELLWTSGNWNDSGAVVLMPPNGEPFISLTAIDENGCMDSDTVFLTYRPTPIANAGKDTLVNCLGDSVELNGQGGSTYSWQWLNRSIRYRRQKIGFAVNEEQDLVLSVKDSNGCIDQDTVRVGFLSSVNLSLKTDGTFCHSDSIVLMADGADGYTWALNSNILNDSGSEVDTVLIEGNYTLELIGMDSLACGDTVSKSFIVHPKPVAQLWSDTTVCSGDTVQFKATGGEYYTWWVGDQIKNSISDVNYLTLKAQKSSRVAVEVENTFGCLDSVSVFMKTHQRANAHFHLPDKREQFMDTISLKNLSTDELRVKWKLDGKDFSDEENPVLKFPRDARYRIRLIAFGQANCNDSLEKEIDFKLLFPELVQNILTPNGDQINDLWEVQGIDGTIEVGIMNRWGQPVYTSTDYHNTWNGTNEQGEILSSGTYFYVLKSSTGLTRSGSITLVR